MDEEAKEFIEKMSPRKKGKLDQWESAIFDILEADATMLQIVEFLKTKGVTAHRSEVYRFVHGKKRLERLGKTGTAPSTKTVEVANQSNKAIPEVTTAQSTPRPVSSEEPKSVKHNEVLKQSAK